MKQVIKGISPVRERLGKRYLQAGAAVGVSLVSVSSHAALSPEAEAAKQAVIDMINDYIGMAWAIVPVALVGWIGVDLFKKAGRKSAK